jgi:hypothetical protein
MPRQVSAHVEPLEGRRLFGFGQILNVVINDMGIFEGNDGQRALNFQVSLGGVSTRLVTVQYTTVSGTARAGEDYASTSGSVSFRAGERAAVISVPIFGDTLIEPDEQFKVRLTSASGANIIKSEGVGLIADDDKPVVNIRAVDGTSAETGETGLFRVTRTGSTDEALRVKYNVLGTAANGQDYVLLSGNVTIPRGKSSAEINLVPVRDSDDEGTEKVTLRLRTDAAYGLGARTQATVTILDSETVAPTAVLTAKNIKSARTRPYQFTVLYGDNLGMNPSSIGNADFVVTGPNGFSVAATLKKKTASADGRTVTALYRVAAPAGSWDAADNGRYTIHLVAGQVMDKSGNAIAAGALGTFKVNITS